MYVCMYDMYDMYVCMIELVSELCSELCSELYDNAYIVICMYD